MKIAVVGSHNYKHLHKVRHYIATIPHGTTVISGNVSGLCQFVQTESKRKGISVLMFNPQWQRYKKRAIIRYLTDIVESSDRIVVFWDGKSEGSKNLISMARKKGKPLQVIR